MPHLMPQEELISYNSSKQTNFRTRVAQFGDGYSQRQPDGINTIIDSWEVSWNSITDTQRDIVLNTLDAIQGWDYIIWTPPDDNVEHKFIMKNGYTYQMLGGGTVHSIQTTLTQVFDL